MFTSFAKKKTFLFLLLINFSHELNLDDRLLIVLTFCAFISLILTLFFPKNECSYCNEQPLNRTNDSLANLVSFNKLNQNGNNNLN
jgi:hypothetical protein